MTTETARPANPAQEDYAGASPARIAKRLFHATRPKFFPASVMPVLVGTAWGAVAASHFDVVTFLLALLATVCVHAGSNVLNDVGDESGGTDRQNELRIYPYTGGSRFIQTGILDAATMTRLGAGLLLVAMIAGSVLISIKGPMILYFGLVGIFLGVLYSLGPAQLSALGLGETAVAVAFGVLPVAGAAWLQGAAINADLVLFSIPVSAWVAAILLINGVPDIEADGATGKRTLPVRIGLAGTAGLYFAIHVAAVASIAVLVVRQGLPLLSPALPALLLVPAWRASSAIRIGVGDRDRLTNAIESTLGIHTVGTVWLIACVLYSLW
ncbi:MAG: 1,4-dihydroxy-2-naphthoate octaprenyltransferase [Burkholderiaceae bacterium]|nr:1,4-dihydroxy-2-naphthoate octaprenyltransferase [Burkholderiaceae bacterium]